MSKLYLCLKLAGGRPGWIQQVIKMHYLVFISGIVLISFCYIAIPLLMLR